MFVDEPFCRSWKAADAWPAKLTGPLNVTVRLRTIDRCGEVPLSTPTLTTDGRAEVVLYIMATRLFACATIRSGLPLRSKSPTARYCPPGSRDAVSYVPGVPVWNPPEPLPM